MQLSQKILTDSMLISSEDVLRQGIEIPRKNFLRYTVDLDFIFHGKDNVILTRKKVIEIFNNNIHHGILSSIVWGFPRGGLPGGRPLNNIFENLDFFKDTISEILENGLCEKSFEIINSKPGVKNGATTKMLYFSGAKIADAKCLIFDSRVRDYILKNKDFELFSNLEKVGEAKFKDESDLLVFTCKFQGILSERSSKKRQFEIAKKIQ
jgi:hypothetical protein